MREIKFRAWDTKKKKMIVPASIIFSPVDDTPMLIGVRMADIRQKGAVGYELMQFTGLLDRNGKEIYESDILRDEDNMTIIVEYGLQEVDAFEGVGFNVWTFMDNANADGKRLQRTYEVIGNIYQDKHLLSKQKTKETY